MHPKKILSLIAAAIAFTLLFYRQNIGLNLFIFEGIFLIFLTLRKEIQLKSPAQIILFGGTILSLIGVLTVNSGFSIKVNFFLLFLFVGSLNYSALRSPITAFALAAHNFWKAQGIFLSSLGGRFKFFGFIYRLRYYLLPLFVVFVFILFYSNANPLFEGMIGNLGKWMNTYVWTFLKDINFAVFLTFVFGLILSIFLYQRKASQLIIGKELKANDQLTRTKKTHFTSFKITALKNHYKAAVFLLFSLNFLLLILNIQDINWVWLGFEWKGQFLKSFVHEGTYLLIASILISIALVLYFFRANLNFYPKNKLLKTLTYIWIAQNAFLLLSVGVRNYHYISYFALAYKRIGVILFLLLTLFGLYTVYLKVSQKKTAFYLLRTNGFALLIALSICSIINWDKLIAKYNFNHSDSAFIELKFLQSLSNNALPILDKTMPALKLIQIQQDKQFHFQNHYMSPESYYKAIQNKKKWFIRSYPNRSWLEWNLSDYQAYKKLN